jgi:hypothetical protein
MATVSTTGLYEEDLNGTNPLNLVTDERHTVVTPGKDDFYFFIPRAAPFFVDSIKVFNHLTGALLVEGADYNIGHKFIDAMKSTGRPIAGSIRLMKRTIQGILRLEYRTLGGPWGFSDAAILAELARRQYNPLIRTWGSIDVLPHSFPSLEHSQPIGTGLVGSVELLAGLERIADVLEASAAGTTEQHLLDFNNPHRTTKQHVLLGNVQNYPMADNQQATLATQADLYISPAGVYLAIQEHAIKKLNQHLLDKANPHEVRAIHIGLDKVPNYPAASDVEALDITNNSVLMTPYTVSLLLQQSSDSGRIDEVVNDLNAHINDRNNPHQLTPGGLADGGAYNRDEIDELLANVSAQDTPKFAGQTEAEWRESLPSFDDMVFLLQGLDAAFVTSLAQVNLLNPLDPVTPAVLAARLRQLIQATQVGYSMYAPWDGNGDSVLVTSSDMTIFPEYIRAVVNRWAQLRNAGYYVAANGAIVAEGSEHIPTPAGYADDVSFNPANKVNTIWATKTAVWLMMDDAPPVVDERTYGSVRRYDVNGAATLYNSSARVSGIFLGTEFSHAGELAIIEFETPQPGEAPPLLSYVCRGDPNWVSSATTAINFVAAQGAPIRDIMIGTTHVVFLNEANQVFLYELRRTPNVNLVRVVGAVIKDGAGQTYNLDALDNVLQISGTYDHFSFVMAEIGTNSEILPYGKAAFFGTNDRGQCDIPVEAGPFVDVAAGYKFTVTVNSKHLVQFWGDSSDNALLFDHRSIPE